ncbi:MAG: HDOD domain-containing protein [bacterium]|nr:HDOD domain-containing protein [bacterium]
MAVDIQITDQDLPVLSAVATQALELIQDPDVTTRKIDELVRQDPSLTQRLLHTANSPFYVGRIPSQSISEAMVRLGLRQLRNVVVVAATGELFNAGDTLVQDMWDHAIACAIGSYILADFLHTAQTEESFIAGMLHDVGKLIIYRQHPELYHSLRERADAGAIPLYIVENEELKYFNHMTVGGLAIRKWRLADSVAEAARFHHDLEKTIPPTLTNKPLACIVSLANVMVRRMGIGATGGSPPAIETLACADLLRFKAALLDPMCERVREAYEAQRPAFA